MIEFLQSIPGPQFLLIYPLLVITCLVIARFVAMEKQNTVYSLPESSRFSPVEIAALRGGWKLVLKTVLFSLWRRELVTIVPDKPERKSEYPEMKTILMKRTPDKYVIKKVKGSIAPSDRLERRVLEFLRAARRPADIFRNGILRSFVESCCNTMTKEFEQLHLVKSAREKRLGWIVTVAVLLVILSVGGTKCVLGFINDRPTEILVLMLALSLPAVFVVMKPAENLTAAGRAYVKRLEGHFGWIKEELGKQKQPEIDPAYAFAIFGTSAVAGTLLYVPKSEASPSHQSGGCGGGSCSGGGCGGGCGGGGCGGGCGGCGA